jgi:hypothetical protein
MGFSPVTSMKRAFIHRQDVLVEMAEPRKKSGEAFNCLRSSTSIDFMKTFWLFQLINLWRKNGR